MEEPKTCPTGFVCDDGRCIDENAKVDASTDAPAIDPLLAIPAFQDPILIAELSDPATNDDDPAFSADYTSVVFNSLRSGTRDLWTSSRASRADPWDPPVLDATLSSAESDSTIALSPDGLTVVFASDRPGGLGLLDLYLATRPNRAAVWSTPVALVDLNSPESEGAGYVSNNGETIVFDSARGVDREIFIARRITGTTYEAPTTLPELGSSESDAGAKFAAGNLAVVFHSARVDGPGSSNLFGSTRRLPTDAFEPPQLIEGANSPDGIEEDPWISDDLCTLVYSRVGETGVRNLFEARCDR